MIEFPEEKIKEWVGNNAGIPNAEIEQEILDTEADIRRWTQEAEAWGRLPMTPEHRLDHMKADSRRSYIQEANIFIAKLKAILKYRKENPEP